MYLFKIVDDSQKNVDIVDYHQGELTMSRTPIHPGEILKEELDVIGISAAGLARQLRVPASRISELTRGRRKITADTALRLDRWFGTSPNFWMNLQKSYELRKAAQNLDEEFELIQPRAVVAYALSLPRKHRSN